MSLGFLTRSDTRATEDGYMLEIAGLKSRGIVPSM